MSGLIRSFHHDGQAGHRGNSTDGRADPRKTRCRRETTDQILEAYPRLTREAMLAAIAFAARSLAPTWSIRSLTERHELGLGALLLTADKDFGELVFRQGKAQNGVVLLRLAGLPAARKAEILSTSLQQHGDSIASCCFTVVIPPILHMRRWAPFGGGIRRKVRVFVSQVQPISQSAR